MTDYTGTPGDDTITSLSGPETIDGGDGTDIITIDRGDDTAGLTYNATKAATDAGWTMEDGTVVRNVEKLDTLTTGTGYDILYVTTAQDGFHWYAGGSYILGTSGDELHFDATNDASAITTHTNEDADGGFDYTIVDAANGIESDAYQLGRVSIHGGDADDHLTGSGTVSGGTGDDTLDGGIGADTMEGGWGSDIYYVDNPGDVIIEGVNGVDDGSLDLVMSSIDYTLTDPLLEGLILIGHDNIDATGNADDNYLMGNDGNNVLSGLDGNDILVDTLGGHDTFLGGPGNDVLTGGDGADRFAFEYAGTNNGVDTVTDYAHGTDSLWFNGADYGVAVGGALTSDMFTAGPSAVGTHGQFIWDASSHTLYWDDDGTGGDAAVAIATFTGVTTIDTSDFHFK